MNKPDIVEKLPDSWIVEFRRAAIAATKEQQA